MPLLAFGSYRVQMDDGTHPSTDQGVLFQFYPIGVVILLFCLLGYVGLYRYPQLYDAAYGRRKLWVLLPGMLGIGVMYAAPMSFQLAVCPLLMPTGIFISMRCLRIQHWVTVIFCTWIVTSFIQAVSIYGMNQSAPSGMTLFVISTISAGICMIPILSILYAIQRVFTVTRVIVGALIGMVLPIGIFAVLVFLQNAPLSASLTVTLFFLSITIPFAFFILFNSWARDVSTGALFQKSA